MKELARVGTDQGLARCLPFCAAPSRLFIGLDDSTILRVHRLDDLGVADAHVLHDSMKSRFMRNVTTLSISSSESKQKANVP